MSARNHLDPVQGTIFANFGAATKREEMICLHDLADRIITTSAASKGELPWLKLATSGDHAAEKQQTKNRGVA